MRTHGIAAVTLALSLAACSSSSSPTPEAAGDGGGGATDATPAKEGGTGAGNDSGGAGGGSADTGAAQTPEAGTPPSQNAAKLVLVVASSFTGTTRELDVVVVPKLPVAGPPAGVLYQAEQPVMTAGQSVTIEGDATGITGENYVVVVLYMQGGGSFQPKPGVDYAVASSSKLAFDGGPIDLGTLDLALVTADGGL